MTRAHGAVVDAKSHHGFGSSKPIAMWDSKTLAPIKTIAVDGSPDGMPRRPFWIIMSTSSVIARRM